MRKFAAIGMFDGVHRGHIHLWQRIKAMAQASSGTSLAVSFTHHPMRLIAPGHAPGMLTTAGQRSRLLHQAGADEVVILDFTEQLRRMTATEFVSMLRERYGVTDLVMGFNNNIGSDRMHGLEASAKLPASAGVTVHIADECEMRTADGNTLSSSSVRRALLQGDVSTAAAVLGRNYRLSGRVVHGHRVGTGLGYPTANIEPCDSSLLVPAPGVYAVDVILDDNSRHRGMLNIGSRPTIADGDNRTTVEVHILNFNGDLYGREIAVEFIKRLRDERQFDSPEALRRQLAADARAASGAIRR